MWKLLLLLAALLAVLCVAIAEQDPTELGAPTDIYQAECTYCKKALHHTWVWRTARASGSSPPTCPLSAVDSALLHYLSQLAL